MSRCRAAERLAVALLVLALGLGGSAWAEEVVFFKSGSELPIVSHKVEGGMIHVDLGGNAFMAFPLSVVDRVEQAGRSVVIGRSSVGGTNVITAHPDPTGSFPAQGTLQSSFNETNRYDDSQAEGDPAVDVVNGVAVYKPLAGSQNPAKASTAFTGNARVREARATPGALRGAHQVGTHQVIGGPPASRRAGTTGGAPVITGIQARDRGANPDPPSQEGTEQPPPGDDPSSD